MMSNKFTLDIPRMGYIIAVQYNRPKKFNIFSEWIFKKQLSMGFDFKHAIFTHVAVSSGGPHLVNVMPPRTRLVNLTQVYKGSYIKILKYNGEDYDNYYRYKISCIYNALAANLKYDYLGVLRFILPFIRQDKRLPFCSEVTAEAYQMFYPQILGDLKPCEIVPAFFLDHKDFSVAWEGFIPF